MFKLLNKIYIIGVLCVAATPVFARVCFLPDGNCEAGKATYSPTNSITGCEYKDETAAKNGLGECQVVYESGFCHYRRCKMSEAECLKKAHEASHASLGTKLKCVVCKDGCWKLEESKYGPDTEHTCKEQGYKTKENCTADYVKFLPVNLVDKDGKQCGVCKDLECSEMGGYVKKGSCPTGEEFEYADKIDAKGNPCGTCKAKTEQDNNPSDPNNGKTYYIIVDNEVTPVYAYTEYTDDGMSYCRFSISGQLYMPLVGNDTFFRDNNIRFGAQIYAGAEFKWFTNASGNNIYQGEAKTVLTEAPLYGNTSGDVPLEFGEPIDPKMPYGACSYGLSNQADVNIDRTKSKYWVLKQDETPDTVQPLSSDCQTITIDGSSRTICYRYKDYGSNEAKVYLAYYPSLMNNPNILDTSKSVPYLSFMDTIEPYNSGMLEYKSNQEEITLTLRQISALKKSSYNIGLSGVNNQACTYKVMTMDDFNNSGASATFMHGGRINEPTSATVYSSQTVYGGSVWRNFPNLTAISKPGEYVAVMFCASTDGDSGYYNRESECNITRYTDGSTSGLSYFYYNDSNAPCNGKSAIAVDGMYRFYHSSRRQCYICSDVK